jgi:hypothetical protein
MLRGDDSGNGTEGMEMRRAREWQVRGPRKAEGEERSEGKER